MAKLNVFDKVGLGEFIIKAARYIEDNRERLLKDPNEALRKYLEIPADRTDDKGAVIKHKIIVHEDSQDVTHMVLPWKVARLPSCAGSTHDFSEQIERTASSKAERNRPRSSTHSASASVLTRDRRSLNTASQRRRLPVRE